MRDTMTLRIIIAIPLMQLFLFGYAINSDPKHLPAGLLSIDNSKYTRTIAAALKNSGYYDIRVLRSEAEADAELEGGELIVRHPGTAEFRPDGRPGRATERAHRRRRDRPDRHRQRDRGARPGGL